MDEEGQKYKVAYCSDRYTENRDKQFCTESLPSLEASRVFSGVLFTLNFLVVAMNTLDTKTHSSKETTEISFENAAVKSIC